MPTTRIHTGALPRRAYALDGDETDADLVSGMAAGRTPGSQPHRAGREVQQRHAHPYARAPSRHDALAQVAESIQQSMPGVRGMLSHGQRAHLTSMVRRLAPQRAHLLAIAQGGISELVDSRVAASAAATIASDILGAGTSVTLSYTSPPRSATVAHRVPPGSVAAPGAPRASRAARATRATRGGEWVGLAMREAGSRHDRVPAPYLDNDDDVDDGEWLVEDDASATEHATAANLGFAYRQGHPLSIGMLHRHADMVAEEIVGGHHRRTLPSTILRHYAAIAVGPRPQATRQRRYDDPSEAELVHRRARAEEEHPHAEEIKKRFPSMVCPITHDIFRDPVVASDGHTYERSAIERWFETASTSPVTNETLRNRALHENVLARNLIAESIKAHEEAETAKTSKMAEAAEAAPSTRA